MAAGIQGLKAEMTRREIKKGDLFISYSDEKGRVEINSYKTDDQEEPDVRDVTGAALSAVGEWLISQEDAQQYRDMVCSKTGYRYRIQAFWAGDNMRFNR